MEESGPESVEGLMAVHPCEYKNGYATRSDMYNVATKFDIQCMYPNGVELHILSEGENGILITGDKGELFVSRGALRGSAVDALADSPLPEDAITKLYKGKKPGSHMANFFDCIKTREQPISDVFSHHRAMTTCHLAIRYPTCRKLKWTRRPNRSSVTTKPTLGKNANNAKDMRSLPNPQIV